jgi:hypothetical protein
MQNNKLHVSYLRTLTAGQERRQIATFSQQQRFKTNIFFQESGKLEFYYIEKLQNLRLGLVNLTPVLNWGGVTHLFQRFV